MYNIKVLSFVVTLFMLFAPATNEVKAQEAQECTISGIVTSATDGLPMIGVSVISGPTSGVTSGIDGDYTIRAVEGTILTFEYLGYKSVEFIIPSGQANVKFDLVMHEDTHSMDEVVVVAYGTRKKGTIAGSVATVKAEKVETTPTAAFDQALQGQVAGLSVLSNSGEPSAAATMTIRGTNSINSGVTPLYILDGVAIESRDFNTINPADIESISVLKDASSTSIYGARAANGVIVITTKRGRISDQPTISYRMQLGFSDIAYGDWDLMNTEQRIQYEKELGLNPNADYNLLSKTDVNWLDQVFSQSAMLQNYEVSVSGASPKTNYYVSGGFYSQDGTAIGSGFERYSMRTNFERRAADWLKIGSNTMINYQEIEEAVAGEYTTVTPISAARFMLPYWNPYNADGTLAGYGSGWNGEGQNPIEWNLMNPTLYKKYKLISTLFAEAKPIENLTLRSQVGVDFSHVTGAFYSYPSYAPNLGSGSVSRSTSDGMTLSITNTATYNWQMDSKNSFIFLLGQEGVDYHYEGFSVTASDQNNDNLLSLSNGTRTESWNDTLDSDYSFLSFFGRAEWSHADRFYADASLRTDGSSRFGTNGRWGQFWSVGGMWNVRNEEFMQGKAHWLSKFQIAASTGTSGNSSIPNYEHLALVYGVGDYMGSAGMLPVQMGNEDLGWEETWTTNLSFRLGMWDRLEATFELYNKKTTDMLMYVPLPFSTSNGNGFQWSNIGALVNRGAELSLSGVVAKGKDFMWTANMNISYNENKITELYQGVQEYEISSTSTKLEVGSPTGVFYLNRYAGVNPANGEPLWYDKDGNIVNEMRDEDKVMVGKSYHAPWQGGFGTNVTWKGISLSAQFSWVADRWMMNNDRFFDESNGRFASYNQSARLLDRWQQPGDITDIPKHGYYTEFDTRLLEDASFLRLKNLMISYTIPAKLLSKSGFVRGAKIYAQGQNLFTFTKFSGLDPEGTSNIYAAQYPMARQYTFGLDLTF